MRTNIVLEDKLMNEAARLTGIKTKRALVDAALAALIREHKRHSLLELDGKLELAPGYDYKKAREHRR